MAIPAVHALYLHGFEIDWVCGRAIQPLLECYTWINVIPADDKSILRGGFIERARQIVALWNRIAWKRYDLCATLYYDRRYGILTLPVRATRKLELSHRSRARTLIPGRHHTDEYTRVLLELEDSCKEQSISPVRPDQLPLSPLQEKRAPRRIGIVPGGVNNLVREEITGRLPDQILRRWPIENFVKLAKLLSNRGWEIVLIGASEDAWVKPYFHDLATIDCIGILSLPEVVSVCDSCDAVVSHDTGPLHLAGLSTACLIGVFGPTDPSTRVPRRPYAIGIWGGQSFACRPCYDGRDFAACQFNGCMHEVTPDLVFRELEHLLYAHSKGEVPPLKIVVPEENSFGKLGLLKLQ
jgi:heptosyltransferase-2